MTRSQAVSIVILNWNGWRDTLDCVTSCQKLTWPNFDIIVVDNASSDGSEKYLRDNLTNVEIIQSGENLGFAAGNNVGIRRALEFGAEYVWLLNNDTLVDPSALTSLMEEIELDSRNGIAGSKIYYHSDRHRIWSAGGFWEKGRLRLRQRGANQLDEGQYDQVCEVGSVSGCSMLVRSAAIRQIGLMEEGFFLYWEDTEWCARAREQGYRVLFVPTSHIWHKVSGSTGHGSFLQFYYSIRNGFRFLCKHDFRLMPVFGFFNMLVGVKFLVRGNVQPLHGFACGFLDFLWGKSGPRQPFTGR